MNLFANNTTSSKLKHYTSTYIDFNEFLKHAFYKTITQKCIKKSDLHAYLLSFDLIVFVSPEKAIQK